MPNDNTKKFNPLKRIETQPKIESGNALEETNIENPDSEIEKQEFTENIQENETGIKKIKNQLSEDAGLQASGIVGTTNYNQKLAQRKAQIENILEEDIKDLYLSLSPEKRREFKIVGEQTAVRINLVMEKTKFKVKEIIILIKSWLSLIPGINKYFLEQEAKIKTDRIIKIKNNEKI